MKIMMLLEAGLSDCFFFFFYHPFTSLISGSGSSGQEVHETPVMHKFAHGARDGEEVFTVEFIKKYLMYAKGERCLKKKMSFSNNNAFFFVHKKKKKQLAFPPFSRMKLLRTLLPSMPSFVARKTPRLFL